MNVRQHGDPWMTQFFDSLPWTLASSPLAGASATAPSGDGAAMGSWTPAGPQYLVSHKQYEIDVAMI